MECSVCMEAFNHEARRPKSLPCGHSFCLLCLQNPAINNLCPQDRQAFNGDPKTLPDNFALLAVVAEARVEGVWCEFCRRQYGAECADAGHRPYSQRQRQAAQDQLGAGVAELRREFEELRTTVLQPSRGVAELRRDFEEFRREFDELQRSVQQTGPGVAELRRELLETQRQVQELRQRGAQPAPCLDLDVEELSKSRRLRKERNDLLLGDQLTQVRNLTGLDCGVDAAWAEAVLHKVAPHLEKLHVKNVQLQHLRAIQGMSKLKNLHLECYGLRENVDVPFLPLQLERLKLKEFRQEHLVSLQWMPRLRNLYLKSNDDEDISLTFSPMPDHCGIRKMTVNFDCTATLLSLVRAHAATLEVLTVNIASSDEYETRKLCDCGLVALRELNLDRDKRRHDKRSCRVQLRAFRKRFGRAVVVECSECDE